MSKDTFYFSHDYNARHDPKMIDLQMKHGMEGVGVFWCLLEMLYEQGGELKTNFDIIAFEMRTNREIIKSVVENFKLFIIEGDIFYSKGVKQRLETREKKSDRAKDNAAKRWDDGQSEKRKTPDECLFYIIRVFDDNESFIKVGITSESVSRRYSGKLNGYNYELVRTIANSTSECLRIESEIIAKFAKYEPQRKFAGSLECLEVSQIQDIDQFALNETEVRNAKKESKGKEKKGEESNSPLPPTEKISEEEEQKFQDELSEVLRPLNFTPIQTESVTEAFAKMQAKGFTSDKIRPCVFWMIQHKPGWEIKFTDLKIQDFWRQDTVKSNLVDEGYDGFDRKNQLRRVTIRLPDFLDQNAVREEMDRLQAEIQENFEFDFSLGGPWEDAEIQRQKIPPEYANLSDKNLLESTVSTNFKPDYA